MVKILVEDEIQMLSMFLLIMIDGIVFAKAVNNYSS